VKRVLQLPTYRRLLAAYGLNELAWSVGTLALAVLVYRKTGSALGSTAFFLCSLVIPAFLSPLAVSRVDQRAPRRILPVLYAVEAVLFGVLAWMAAHFSLAPVLALSLADGMVALVGRVLARTATVDVLRPADLLQEGNAVSNAVFSVCFMAGPAIGGVVVAAGGTVAALLVNCGLFAAISVVLVTTVGLPSEAHEKEPSAGRLRAALTHVRQNYAQRWLLLLQLGGLIAFTISIPVEVVYAQKSLHAGAAGYGALLSGWGVGAMIGSAIYARWRRHSARALMALSGVVLTLGFTLMASASSIVLAVIGAGLGGVGNGIGSVAARTALQEHTAQRWMAMVMTLNEAIGQAAPGVGILLGGVITALANPRAALAIAGAGSLAFTIAVWVVLRPGHMPELPTDTSPAPMEPPPESVPASPPSRETLVQ
jgi:predicted MFS family arabinose efflux permease